MRTITEERVSLSEYRDLSDARAQIGQFLTDVYQNRRIHSSLGYLTPPSSRRLTETHKQPQNPSSQQNKKRQKPAQKDERGSAPTRWPVHP